MMIFGLESGALDRLMPMHLALNEAGLVLSAGPTLSKIFTGPALVGQEFFNLFEIRRPGGTTGMDDLRRRLGDRLSLVQRVPGGQISESQIPGGQISEGQTAGGQTAGGQTAGGQTFRGIAQPMAAGGGVLINLSFGIDVIAAVSAHKLTDADFTATDLAMELLYLVEAKSAVMDELRQLNLRLKGARDAAEEQALTDMLTGLRNRRALDLVMEDAISRNVPFGLMHIDLDYFKAVNDTLGHAAGDHVLREVANVLTQETRPCDTVARVGGDEFVVVIEGLTQPARLSKIAGRLVSRMSQPFDFEGMPCRISASIGITVSTDYNPPTSERMLGDADQALYASKHAGRGRALMFVGPNANPNANPNAKPNDNSNASTQGARASFGNESCDPDRGVSPPECG